MKKSKIKRLSAVFLAVVMCLSVFFGMNLTANAAGEKVEALAISFPRSGDSNSDAVWGHDELVFLNGWSSHKTEYSTVFTTGSYSGNICYCIEPNTSLTSGDKLTQKDENYFDNLPSDYNNVLSPDDIKLFIGRIFQYGYTGAVSTTWRSQNNADADKLAHAITTQILIWETIVGERDADFNHVDTGSKNAVLDIVGTNHPLYDRIMTYYNNMVSQVSKHSKVPSFCAKTDVHAPTVELEKNGSEYKTVLKDTNGVLNNFNFSTDVQGVSFSVSGNELTVTADKALSNTITVNAVNKNALRRGLIIWSDGVFEPGVGIQDLTTFAQEMNDPVRGFVKFKVSPGAAKIVKTSEDGKIDGIEFTVSGNGINKTVKTNSKGEILIDNLNPGVYTVTEKSYENYEPQESRKVTVVNGQPATVTFNNKLKRGQLSVTKTSEDGLVEGVKFHLSGTSNSGLKVDEYAVTDNTGTAKFNDVLIGSNYVLSEVDTADRYVISDNQSVSIEWNKVTEKSFHNILKKVRITVSKSGETFSSVKESDGVYQPIYSVTGLAGAVFEITAAEDIRMPDGTIRYHKGDVATTLTTETDGKAVSEPLCFGKYEIRETKAPEGMVLNTEPQIIELSNEGQETEIGFASFSFRNERRRVKINLTKAMEQNKEFGIGMNGEICSVKFGLYTAEDLTAADGKVIPKNGLLETVSCNEDGYAAFVSDMPVGVKLYVKEISTDEHYLISNKSYPVELTYAGQDTAVVNISVNNGQKIKNDIIYGSVIGKKFDDDGFAICGALFGLFRPDETEFTEDTAILTATSNEIGVFGFSNVPYGNWVIRELNPAPGFVLNENIYPVTVSKSEEIVEIEIENHFIKGTARTTKVNAEYPENKLTGAVFEIYVDVNGDKEFSAEVDKLIGEMAEVEEGIYEMSDLRYNGYFLYEKTAPKGFVKDNNYHYFEILDDGETVDIENEAGVGFINKPGSGGLEITKKDISTGNLLPNAGFRIKNEDGEIVVEGYTDENGIAKFELPFGKYTYEEFEAPEGYIIDTEQHEFEITEDGQIIKAEMTNEKAPQTGDDSHLGFWLGLSSIAIVGLIACGISAKKKKDDDGE